MLAYGSASSTLESKDSTQTINSRTGLIPSPSVVQPAYSNQPQQLTGSMSGPDEPHIMRTRRRVKDPYAIDLSDEDDDDEDEDEDQLTALPTPTNQHPPQVQVQRHQAPETKRPQAPRQESLMDFLNGMEPPSTSKPQPFMLSEETIAAARARAAASSNPSLSSATSTPRNNYGNGNNHNNSTPAFGSISSSNNSASHNKPRLQARAPAVADNIRGGGGGGGGGGSGFGGGGSRTATSDLADFLKNSGPPEMPEPRQQGRKEEEKKSKRFWRRGKTYGDLP
ncbi:hypothetical protein J4E83_004428 [Alternaria metachromatica]|uniref:uncharacterized protein n=1 Tax=Alternaria metachromatica TaxID=283354 RepID=UPI0020C58582|nr:uncharacterized protein J4E83_004428 [Alternaria metachromatica]KAI4624752.1 hypothetical protein J4E83_004428 [Alternaria metachromatica]